MNLDTPYRRPDRVAQQILQIIGEIASRNIDLTSLGFITFTKAEISSDLKQAKIFYSVIQPKLDLDKISGRLNRLSSAFRKYLGPELSIKSTPELHFYHDDSLEYADKLNKLLSNINPSEDDNDNQPV